MFPWLFVILMAFISVCIFEDTSSSICRLALAGKAPHQSAHPEVLNLPSGGVHGWACCWNPWVDWAFGWFSKWVGQLPRSKGADLVPGSTWVRLDIWFHAYGKSGTLVHEGRSRVCIHRGGLKPGALGAELMLESAVFILYRLVSSSFDMQHICNVLVPVSHFLWKPQFWLL